MRFDKTSLVMFLAVSAAVFVAAGPARALDPIDFALEAPLEDAGKARYASDDDDEDAFFSGGKRRGSTSVTGAIAATVTPRVAAGQQRPTVDVAGTCRAVLADNLSLYDPRFLDNCQRALMSGQRRAAR